MEFKNHQDYKAIEAIISSLELQLEEVNRLAVQDFAAAESEINNHFEECINAIIHRRKEVLNQLTQLSEQHGALVAKVKSELIESIELQKDTLAAGVNMYHKRVSMAEQFWKVAFEMKLPDWNPEELLVKLEVDLPSTLLDTIKLHGNVMAVQNSIQKPIFSQINNEPESDIDASNNQTEVFQSFDNSLNIMSKNISFPNIISSTSESQSIKTSQSALVNPASIQQKFSKVDSVRTMVEEKFNEDEFESQYTGICFHANDGCFYVCDRQNGIKLVNINGWMRTKTFAPVKDVTEIAYHQKEKFFYATQRTVALVISHEGYIVERITHRELKHAHGIAIDQKTGKVFVSDVASHQIFVIVDGVMNIHVGSGIRGRRDGEGYQAQFSTPTGICFNEKEQTLLVCDVEDNLIRSISQQKKIFLCKPFVTTVCKVPRPMSITITPAGNILITSNSQLFQLIQEGGIYRAQVLAGSETRGSVDGDASQCRFDWPSGIAADENSNTCVVTEGCKLRTVLFNIA